MKNKFLFLFFFIFFFCIHVQANTFIFETKNLTVLEKKNEILANEGLVRTSDNRIEIFGNKFIYKKNYETLTILGNGKAIINPDNLIIEFDKAIFNNKKSTIEANGAVYAYKTDKKFFIKSKKILYEETKNLLSSDTQTKLIDTLGNNYFFENFRFHINKDLLKVKNLEFLDTEKNKVFTKLAYINTNSGNIFGKDLTMSLNSISIKNEGNEPRIKANKIIRDGEKIELGKGVFTTCKKTDNCPPWQISARKITHNSKKKIIYYDDATLKIYNFPVLYFPKFFHPDPSVKRQSGFLIPLIKNSKNSNNFINLPYFIALSNNKDATISPRFYDNKKLLIQTEYRQKNKNSSHISDFSILNENNKSSKSHFFYEYENSFQMKNFDSSSVNLKLQKVSNDTYIKKEKIKNMINQNEESLENSIFVDLSRENLNLNIAANIYEDLNKSKNDRFEYIFPRIELIKRIKNRTSLNGNFNLKSKILARNFETNIYERKNINDLFFKSIPIITPSGFYNNYEFLVKNRNSDNDNYSYKNDRSSYLSTIFQYNLTKPLIKEEKTSSYQKILKPKLSFKLAPKHTKNSVNEETKIDINNIYSLDRFSEETTEGGFSATFGGEYSLINKFNSKDILNIKIANNLRLKENSDLSRMNQLDEKTSNIFSEINFIPNKFITAKYQNSIKNNLQDFSFENLITEFTFNKIVTKFDYLNENNTSLKNSYLKNETSINFNNSNKLTFSTRENKSTNLTEYYNLMYQYKNDCLIASIEYNKDFYNDGEITPNQNIFFKLTFIPFGEVSSNNLKN